ncbi:ribonuclease domain-containing protein [Arenimonas sp. MALMAid1274]|uniref:ribonuclease domain-containing protein n=1 Tax=Arenimonas sp. MALMAid1274 TaxID=3411630 RepID=UPI003BA2FEE2
MRKFRPLLAVAIVLMLLWTWWQPAPEPGARPAPDAPASTSPTVALPAPPPALPAPSARPDARVSLPPEAERTLALIARGGPFPYRQDGGVFGNRERRLPPRPRGHYREYTVDTPGLSHRGPRRIVTGGDPPTEFWYTDDHYDSFRRIEGVR